MSVAVAARTALAACDSVSVVYGDGEAQVEALRDVDLEIAAGDHLALLGRSGSGKTTLLHVLGGLLVPTSGTVRWKGEPLSTLDAAARGRARAQGIAYVFQGVEPASASDGVGERRLRGPGGVAARCRWPWPGRRFSRLVGLPHQGRLPSGRALRRRVAAGRRSPGRLPSAPSCCSATSPPAISTRIPGTACST